MHILLQPDRLGNTTSIRRSGLLLLRFSYPERTASITSETTGTAAVVLVDLSRQLSRQRSIVGCHVGVSHSPGGSAAVSAGGLLEIASSEHGKTGTCGAAAACDGAMVEWPSASMSDLHQHISREKQKRSCIALRSALRNPIGQGGPQCCSSRNMPQAGDDALKGGSLCGVLVPALVHEVQVGGDVPQWLARQLGQVSGQIRALHLVHHQDHHLAHTTQHQHYHMSHRQRSK